MTNKHGSSANNKTMIKCAAISWKKWAFKLKFVTRVTPYFLRFYQQWENITIETINRNTKRTNNEKHLTCHSKARLTQQNKERLPRTSYWAFSSSNMKGEKAIKTLPKTCLWVHNNTDLIEALHNYSTLIFRHVKAAPRMV